MTYRIPGMGEFEMTDAEVKRIASYVGRARSAINSVEGYRLGAGGYNPRSPSPGRFCDCSGFVAWVLGVSRVPKPARPWWIETTNIWRDATGPSRVFVKIERPIPGCLVVYPDASIMPGILKRTGQGHVAVVSKVSASGILEKMVDCSKSRNGVCERRDLGIFGGNPSTVYCVLRQDLDGWRSGG